MPSPISLDRALPDFANANIWRAGELASASLQTVDTGYAALDQVLPGGGWPLGAMVEVLQPQAGLHEWGLVAPALALRQAASPDQTAGRLLVLVGPPHRPFGPALEARQIAMPRLLCVQGAAGNAPSLLWATRESLQCADVAAVLAWLPDARSAHLRRLQMAAHTHHKLLFVFRPLRAQHESSPAPLRVLLEGTAEAGCNLRVHVFKRRGPLLGAPVLLDTRPARLSALLGASSERARRQREDAAQAASPVAAAPGFRSEPVSPTTSNLPDAQKALTHALLDRLAHVDHLE
ncbi:MAG: translesion DNA synthesis-associated protein ImuA [Polaromonas sp.]|nr:translesion DNA synthesis-associated protein ImuA [Polaromonas sp.]